MTPPALITIPFLPFTNIMTSMNSRFPRLLAGCFALCAITSFAQTTPDSSQDETILLSPFEVRENDNRGYVAAETLTGTRVATQIKDLPYTVNVITSEFFEDFAMFQLDDTLTQVGGLTGLDVGGGFNLRGFASSSQLRDGFYRQGRYGQTNIDRIEVIKGPNAGIYGRSSPGGMVNMISKSPQKKNVQKLTLRGGSFDTLQGTVETTGTLGSPKTYYTAIVSQLNRAGDVDYFHIRENQAYLAVKHDFDNGGHLLFSGEHFIQHRHSQTGAAPIITDQKNTSSNLDDEVIGYAKELARFNPYGPASENSRSANTLRATYDKQLGSIFNFRAGAQLFSAKLKNYNANTGFGGITINSTNAANNYTSTRGATPNRGIINEDGGGVQLDLVARYHLANRAISNKTLVTVDYNDYYRFDPTRNSAATSALAAWGAAGSGRVVALNSDFTPVAPLIYFTARPEDGLGAATRYTRRRISVVGGQFRQESRWLKERLLTYFGSRFDKVHFSQLEYITTVNGVVPTMNAPVPVKRDVNQVKPNAGALFKVKENLRVYANYSESYFINQGENPVDVASSTYKSETAKGWDYGVKGSFFNERLNYTIGLYNIRRYGVRVTDAVETPVGSGNFVDVTRSDGDQEVNGWEADITWSINQNWSTGVSVAHVDAFYNDFGSRNPQAVGRKVQNISPENGGAWLKFTGSERWMKNFSANLGVTYIAETPSESPIAGDTIGIVNGAPAVTRSTYQWRLTVPSVTLWNLGISYRWKQNAHASHSFRVNVNNVFDKDYLKVNKNLGDPLGVYFSYTLSFSDLFKQ
jgi:outer membrane receptor protein involved in Fe transport